MQRERFIDYSILYNVFSINLHGIVVLFSVAYILFIFLPRRIFPQHYAGAGIENIISNILYMLVFIELVVPLLVFIKLFNTFTFIASLIGAKLFFVKFYEKRSVKAYLLAKRIAIMVAIFHFFDNYREIIAQYKKQKVEELYLYFRHLNYYQFFKKVLIFFIFTHLIYILGYRCFISMANPLPDNSQFFEWVANLERNILYADNKTVGADFYGISVFVFILKVFTHIDSIVLFNIYPLLLITFLLFGVYFVIKRFTISSLLALFILLLFGSFFIGSPLNSSIAAPILTFNNPSILSWWHFTLYTIPQKFFIDPELKLMLEDVAMRPYLRYFSGMAYEFSSTMYLLNLFYLIKALDKGKSRYLYNYTLTLMLVFIFHGGGAIALIVPSMLIAVNAFISLKLSWSLFARGLLGIVIAAIFGNGWMLSVIKYGIPQDFGAAAPFLDKLFGTKQAIKEIVTAGIEEVTISHLTSIHLLLLLSALIFFIMARLYKKGFYFSSFLLIPLGFFVVYFAQNLGLPKLVHPARGAEYLFLSITIIAACYVKLFVWLPLRFVLRRYAKPLFLFLLYITLFISLFFIPHYKDTEQFKKYINGVQYSAIPYYLYQIVKQNTPLSWTVVSYVQEYSKVLGKGYMINANEFVTKYNPLDRYLPIPTKKVYIFVEDIPHTYKGKDEWFYRWRRDVETNLKEWVALYSAKHNNIRIFAKSQLLTVYEIDNSQYIKLLERKNRVRKY